MTALADRPHFVYRIFDAEGSLIYLGATSNLRQRIGNHAATKSWPNSHPVLSVGERMTAWVATRYPTRAAAFAAERGAIADERPELNTYGIRNAVVAAASLDVESTEECPMNLQQDYSLDDVAKALGMSTRWVRDRIKHDKAPHQRYGHKIRFTAEQVEQLRATHTKQPVTQSITTGKKKKSA